MQFTEKERAVFAYFDGEAQVFGDPLDLNRRMSFECGGNVRRLLMSIRAGAPRPGEPEDRQPDAETVMDANVASEKLCLAIRAAFGMKDFDRATGAGATEAMCFGVWNHFCAWLAEKKNRPATSPTSPPSMASFPPSA